jgi:hypothetical protein
MGVLMCLYFQQHKRNRFAGIKYCCTHVKLLYKLSFPWNANPCHELLTHKSPSGRFSSLVSRCCCGYSLRFSSPVCQTLNAVCCHPGTLQFHYDGKSQNVTSKKIFIDATQSHSGCLWVTVLCIQNAFFFSEKFVRVSKKTCGSSH